MSRTVAEVQEMKKELEKNLLDLIREFETQCEVSISSIDTMSSGGGIMLQERIVQVKVEVKI